MIVSLGSRRQPVAERSRGQGMNVLSKKGMKKLDSSSKKKYLGQGTKVNISTISVLWLATRRLCPSGKMIARCQRIFTVYV